jgi:uncharacterized protein YggE
MTRQSVVLALVASLVSAGTGAAQEVPPAAQRGPEIMSAGEGTRSVQPDRASVVISIETRARTPTEASAANATRNAAIRAAVAGVGVPREDISTYGYHVYPVRHEPPYTRDTAFVASNAVRVTLRRVEQLGLLGRVIDTALTAGATNVAGVQYEARRTAEAEREALADALADARARAEAVARAAGGSLGELLQATTQSVPGVAMDLAGGMARAQAMRARMGPTSITPGEIEVRQYVVGRWRFVPGRR